MVGGRGIPPTGFAPDVPGLDNGPMPVCIISIGLLGWHNAGVVAGRYVLFTIGALITATRCSAISFLLAALESRRHAGCRTAYIDGSFISKTDVLGDYDACWDPVDVDPQKLDPVLLIFDYGRAGRGPGALAETT